MPPGVVRDGSVAQEASRIGDQPSHLVAGAASNSSYVHLRSRQGIWIIDRVPDTSTFKLELLVLLVVPLDN